MSKKTAALVLILMALPIAVYFLWPSDTSRIKKLVKEGAEAVEKEDIEGVMSKISRAYRDDFGLNYMMIKHLLGRQFEAVSDMEVEYESLKIKVDGRNAVAEMDVLVLATIDGETGYILGDLRESAHARFYLGKEGAKWLVLKTEGIAGEGRYVGD